MKTQQTLRELFVPVVRHTQYGRWTEDGLYVIGSHGQVIYRHPLAPKDGFRPEDYRL